MTSFNFDDISSALNVTDTKTEAKGVSFENKNLKLDTVADAKSLVEAIEKCECLEFLNLAGNTLGVDASEAVAKALETHPEFKRALWKDLFTGRLKDEIPKSLTFLGNGLVKANARLTELDLSDNAFGPIGVKGLVALLSSPSCYNLQQLRLNNNGLGITGGKMLATALLNCYNYSKEKGTPLALRVFIAGRNRLENEGAKALANVFQTIGTLQEVAMPQNGIYHVGVKALSEAFARNPDLRVLNLYDNTVGSIGSAALAETLSKLTKLQKLNLGDCLLKTKGAIHIASALMKLNDLETVLLDSNEIHLLGGEALAKALANKPRLKSLNLDTNMFGSDGEEKIRKLLGANADKLQPMDENESADEEEEEDNEDDDGDENEEEEKEESEDEIEKSIEENSKTETFSQVSIHDFLGCPSGQKLLGLGDNAPVILLQEAESEVTLDSAGDCTVDTYLNTYIPVLMKVAALVNDADIEVSKKALEYSDLLFRRLFEWAEKEEQRGMLLDNALLVHLGLIKSEDKKYRPPWDVKACMKAVNELKTKEYFPKRTNEFIKIFTQKMLNNNNKT